jgi:hypothetical protein
VPIKIEMSVTDSLFMMLFLPLHEFVQKPIASWLELGYWLDLKQVSACDFSRLGDKWGLKSLLTCDIAISLDSQPS